VNDTHEKFGFLKRSFFGSDRKSEHVFVTETKNSARAEAGRRINAGGSESETQSQSLAPTS
jgi:hypothetical protein